jgi:hypothetical protein
MDFSGALRCAALTHAFCSFRSFGCLVVYLSPLTARRHFRRRDGCRAFWRGFKRLNGTVAFVREAHRNIYSNIKKGGDALHQAK